MHADVTENGFAMLDFTPILKFEFKRLLRSVIVLSTNLLMAAITIVAIRVLGLLFQSLWRDDDPRLFDTVSLNYILHAADLAVLLLFLVNGVQETYRLFRGRKGPFGKSPGSGK
jgi:hypothetical protein